MRPATHLALCRFMERKTGSSLLDQARYHLVSMPRETGKSSLMRARAIQRICRNPNSCSLLINEKELLVKDFLALRLRPIVSLSNFRRTWDGLAVADRALKAIRFRWENCAVRRIQTVRERQKNGLVA